MPLDMPQGDSRAELLAKKWEGVLDHKDYTPIAQRSKRLMTARLLENQDLDRRGLLDSDGYNVGGLIGSMLNESAPTNHTGAGIQNYDPVLISLVRRAAPNLISYDIMGTQALTGPTGLIFAIYSRYTNQTGAEALFNEANTTFSASAAGNTASAVTANNQTGSNPATLSAGSEYTYGKGMSTAAGEALGDGSSNAFREMAFSITKTTATAVTRALKAEFTTEMAQDLRAIHGLDAEAELSQILTNELLAEINRECVRLVNQTATVGAQENVATAGTFDLDVDSNGRWMVEKFKGLMFQLEREANQLAKSTRRGKGNIMICSSDVASALNAAGLLSNTPKLTDNLNVDDTGNTFAGVTTGGLKVYVDPYFISSSGLQYATVGYKGSSAFDAGIFYCPYVPLQMVRAVGENTFQPKIGFKTRYAIVANPFATTAGDGVVSFANKNRYYRRVAIKNIM